MKKINVLVMGNSGAGKSTLINAIFKFDKARTGDGPSITREMAVYEKEEVPFRCIDTRGLEYGAWEQVKTFRAIRKWSKKSVADRDEKRYIHLIWYCMDATSKRIFKKQVEHLRSVSRLWKDVPVILVLTKSYSRSEIPQNEAMVRQMMEAHGEANIKGVVSVVAKPFPIQEDLILPALGLEELVRLTNESVPEAMRLTEAAVADLDLRIKRGNANALTALATTGAAVVGAVPIPFADSPVLMAIQSGLVVGIGKAYKLPDEGGNFSKIAQTIIMNGTVSLGAKNLLSVLKGIPGLNVAAAVMNAAVAAVFTAVIGVVAVVIVEKIARGELDPEDLDWIAKFSDNEFTRRAGKYAASLGKGLAGREPKKIGQAIADLFTVFNEKGDKNQ